MDVTGKPPTPLSAVPASPPPADLRVDAELVHELCDRLTPSPTTDMAAVHWEVGPRPLGEGWDCVLWPVGTLHTRPLVLKVPRRALARTLLRQEETVLRHLAGSRHALPMEVPRLLAATDGALLLPWTPGTTAAESDAVDAGRVPEELAAMLAAVHSLPAPVLAQSAVRGVPLAMRASAFEQDLERALGAGRRGTGLGEEFPMSRGGEDGTLRRGADGETGAECQTVARMRARAVGLWERGVAADVWKGPGLLLHGDPHPGNVIVPAADPSGRCVLIDWGDATCGDPAGDLGGLLLHDPSGTVLATYRRRARWRGIDDEAVWDALEARARAWGSRLALALLTAYGPQQPLGRAARRFLGG